MIFVDTNVLIRLMTDDIPALRAQAESWLKLHGPGELVIPDTTLTELFFVLQNSPIYSLSRAYVCDSLRNVLKSPQWTVGPEAIAAIDVAEKHPRLDFTDCLLATYASHKKSQLLTFDKDLLKILS